MPFDAIVLAGGRSSRLDSAPKAEFTVDGVTLLDRTLAAVGGARRIVVVGPEPGRPLPDAVLLAAIAAGLDALREGLVSPDGAAAVDAEPGDATLVLACDMPQVHLAVGALEKGLAAHPDADGVIAVDSDGREQPLAACYRTRAIVEAVARRRAAGPLDGMRVFGLIDDLDLRPIVVPTGTTSDVDSWADAARLSALPPTNR